MEYWVSGDKQISPKVSIALLDWSCRESFHTLDYLNNQTSLRNQYEIIWIEYYNKRPQEIDSKIKEYEALGKPPFLDKRIVMGIEKDVYYHKHLMYNMGILASRGEIICFCDSDAIVKPTFVESIISAFEKERNIVLHMDEIRNISKSFYPFNYPSFEEITNEGCLNYKSGKTTGLLDREDALHTRNYGACMCALRSDLVNIGGADQHISYLGHICGPYELTFRLINAGRKEVWHQEEFLYHTWHPGTDGRRNYLGPNDGRNMSTTALNIISCGRILPLVENPAIKLLRSKKEKFNQELLLSRAILESKIEQWEIGNFKLQCHNFKSFVKRMLNKFYRIFVAKPKGFLVGTMIDFVLSLNIFWMSFKQLFYKSANYAENKVMPKSISFKLQLIFIFFWRMWKNNSYALSVCRKAIESLKDEGASKIALYGVSDVTKILFLLAKKARIKIVNIYDTVSAGKSFLRLKVSAIENLRNYEGKIIIASFVGIKDKGKKIESLGIPRNNIFKLQ